MTTSSPLDTFGLCLGGNVFGWTADEKQSFEILDAYAEAGGNFIDTADSYVAWIPGNSGGESETIIGKWMASRNNREQMIIATKVAKLSTRPGLSPANIAAAAEDSLRRLQTDYIDLYYAHQDDDQVPFTESLGAFDALVKAGKVRHIGASNFTAARLSEALDVSSNNNLAAFVALQPEYNLVARDYENELMKTVDANGLATYPYYALASGFLTGKYRRGSSTDSARAGNAERYLNDHGIAVLNALDDIAANHDTSVTAVSLAWLAAQPTIGAPIASARTAEQVKDLTAFVDLKLTTDEIARLSSI